MNFFIKKKSIILTFYILIWQLFLFFWFYENDKSITNITINNLKIDIVINVTNWWQFKKIINKYLNERFYKFYNIRLTKMYCQLQKIIQIYIY